MAVVAESASVTVDEILVSADEAIREANGHVSTSRYPEEQTRAEIDAWWSDQRFLMSSDDSLSTSVETPGRSAVTPKNQAPGSTTTASREGMTNAFLQQGTSPSTPSPRNRSGSRAAANWSLALGVVSFFVGGLVGLVALTAIAVAGWTVINGLPPKAQRWKGWLGLILAVLSGWFYLVNYGHVDIS